MLFPDFRYDRFFGGLLRRLTISFRDCLIDSIDDGFVIVISLFGKKMTVSVMRSDLVEGT